MIMLQESNFIGEDVPVEYGICHASNGNNLTFEPTTSDAFRGKETLVNMRVCVFEKLKSISIYLG